MADTGRVLPIANGEPGMGVSAPLKETLNAEMVLLSQLEAKTHWLLPDTVIASLVEAPEQAAPPVGKGEPATAVSEPSAPTL